VSNYAYDQDGQPVAPEPEPEDFAWLDAMLWQIMQEPRRPHDGIASVLAVASVLLFVVAVSMWLVISL
jgi:hypothetical protein